MIIYLIGGLGNQLIQLNAFPNAISSKLLCNTVIGRIFNFKIHNNNISIFSWREAIALFFLPLFFIDLVIARITNITLFTYLDVNKVSSKPIIFTLFVCGYFQKKIAVRHSEKMYSRIVASCKLGDNPFANLEKRTIVIHVRGGDALNTKNIDVFGKLPLQYYECAINSCDNILQPQIYILSDDFEFVDRYIPFKHVKIKGDLNVFFTYALHSDIFVGSNSTLSLCTALARTGNSYLPTPFQKKGLQIEPSGSEVTLIGVQY